MNRARVPFIAVALLLIAEFASAQDLSRYRGYVLESTLQSVITASGTRASDVRTLHERPAKIEELEWRAPYASSREVADSVRGATFTFFNDVLYQVVVKYDRDRTDGLTNNDIIQSLVTIYGTPVLKSTTVRPPATLPDALVLAHWDGPTSAVTLLRGIYSPDFQLILTSKAAGTRARDAIREAGRLDAIEAPRRELEQRKQEVADAAAARDKIRTANKAAFRP
jgi:hypothetical protein